MKKYIESIENKVIRKYGFENKKTLYVFRITEAIRTLLKLV